jgi:methyl-accepting chemotaxis protein
MAVIAEQALAEVLAPAQAMTRLILTASATILLVTGLVSYFLSRSLTTPILALAGAIERLDSRQLDTAIPALDRGDELGLISRGLDRLRSTLAAGRNAERENQFRGAALENASAALMIMDADFVVSYANPAVLHLLRKHASSFRLKVPNFDPERVIGQPMDSFHAAPAKVRRMIENPANLPYTADIAVGDERFALTVSYIPDGSGGRLGYVLEWEHVTVERMNAALLGTLDRTQAKAIFDRSGSLSQVNANFASALGLEADRLSSYRIQDLLAQSTDQEDWVQALEGNACFKKFHFTAQQTAILEGSLSPIVDRTGTITRIAFLGVDITEASARLHEAEILRERMAADQMQVVNALSGSLDRISEGDLSFEISDVFAADYEALRFNFNTTLAKLNRAMTAVVENATAISLEAAEVSSASSELGLRTERQAATLEQTAAALDELTTSVSSAAEAAANAQSVASDTCTKAEIARASMKDAIAAMNSISQSSEQIRRINSVIDDIAFQTNLLALNAGVEAARAGPAGRGFAVVASEVRALSQRATEAAREIGQLIDISSEQVSGGVDRVHEVGRSLAKMIEAFGIVYDRVTAIAASAREQSIGLHEINRSLAELDQTTQQNAATFEETMAASVALTRNAQNLEATTAQFRVNGIIVPKDRNRDSETNRAA